MTLAEAAQAVGVSAGTLRRWVAAGVIPQYAGEWTAATVGQARLVQRMRERGHTLEAIREATADGRLAFGPLAELFGASSAAMSLRRVAREVGLDERVVTRIAAVLGMRETDGFTDDDLQLMRYVAAVIDAGLPVEAALQLARVYAQAIAQIADAEVRLVHLYVHEPLMRSGGSPEEMAQELLVLAGEALPVASPVLDRLHQRMLAQFIEQDIVGHMEAELSDGDTSIGRIHVAIAFADLAGYTRLTEEAGELAAFDVVERFVDAVAVTLPDDARIIKSLGDEVMVVGSDPAALALWAVGFQQLQTSEPLPRIAVHHGHVLYREGDYYGREVNLAARIAARSAAGEVLVTRAIVEAVGSELEFDRLAEVRLKGFAEPTEMFVARPRPE
jgi:adenylate cyclase